MGLLPGLRHTDLTRRGASLGPRGQVTATAGFARGRGSGVRTPLCSCAVPIHWTLCSGGAESRPAGTRRHALCASLGFIPG